MPRATSACEEPGDVLPWNRIAPVLGFSIFDTARSVVVLPAPFAPMSATTCPRPGDHRSIDGAVVDPQVLHLEDLAVPRHRVASGVIAMCFSSR